MDSLNLSIIIVTYNCSKFVEKMLDELLASLERYSCYEILVLDNNSSDSTVHLLQKYRDKIGLEASRYNYGFAKANNILIERAKYKNVLLLNPDVFGFSSSFWKTLFTVWDGYNPLFIKLLNPDGTFQDCVGEVVSLKRIFKRKSKHYYSQINESITIGMGIMAFMLTTNRCFKQVGLISEDYHMYAEDMDWCYRARKLGYKIMYNPSISLVHIGGASSSTIWKDRTVLLKKYKSERIFIMKHYAFVYKWIMLGFNFLKCLKCKMI